MKSILSILFLLTINFIFSQDTIKWANNSEPVFGYILVIGDNPIPSKSDFLKKIKGTWVFESYTTPCGKLTGEKNPYVDTLILTADNLFKEVRHGETKSGKYTLTVQFIVRGNKDNKTLITDCGNLENVKKYTLVDVTLNYFNKGTPHSSPMLIIQLAYSKLTFRNNVFAPDTDLKWKHFDINYRKVN